MKHLISYKYDGMDESFLVEAKTFKAGFSVTYLDEGLIAFDINGCECRNIRDGDFLDPDDIINIVEEINADIPNGALVELNAVLKFLFTRKSLKSLFA